MSNLVCQPKRIAAASLAGYIGVAVQTIVALALTPFVIEHVGVESYGIWALVNALIAFATLLEAPSALAAIKYMSRSHVRDHPEQRNRLVSNLLAVQLGIGLVVSAAVVGIALGWPSLFSPEPAHRATADRVWLVIGTAVALSFPVGMSKALLVGMGRLVEVQVLGTLAALLNATLVFFTLRQGGGLLCLGSASAAALLSAGAAAWVRVAWLSPGLRVSPRHCRWSQLRELAAFGGASFVTNVAMTFVRRIDVVLLSGPLGLGAVAVYQIAARIADQLQSFLGQLANALTPAMGELFASDDRPRRAVWFLRGSQMSLALAVVPCLFLFVYAEAIIAWWVGERFLGAVAPLRLLAVGLLIGNLEDHVGNVLSMGGRHKALAVCWIVVAATKLASTLLLLPVLGLAAPAAGTLFGAVVGKLLIEFPVALRLLEIDLLRYLKSVLAPVVPAAVIGLVCLSVLSARTAASPSLLMLLLHLTAGTLAFGLVFILVEIATRRFGEPANSPTR